MQNLKYCRMWKSSWKMYHKNFLQASLSSNEVLEGCNTRLAYKRYYLLEQSPTYGFTGNSWKTHHKTCLQAILFSQEVLEWCIARLAHKRSYLPKKFMNDVSQTSLQIFLSWNSWELHYKTSYNHSRLKTVSRIWLEACLAKHFGDICFTLAKYKITGHLWMGLQTNSRCTTANTG